jgi:CheY-like chemotaxis protein
LRVLYAEPHAAAREALAQALDVLGVSATGVGAPDEGVPPEGVTYDIVLWPESWPRPGGLGGAGAEILLMGGGTRLVMPAGVSGWLPKPVRRERLSRRLTRGVGLDVPSQPGTMPPATIMIATGAGLRVLVAEDNPVNQRVMGSMLERLGARATIVSDGRAAVDALDEAEFDLVLMDGQMPGMDGETAARVIRARSDAAGRIPIIAVTAHAMAGDRERFLSVGMDDHLPKPVTLAALAALLGRYGEKRAQAVAEIETPLPGNADRAAEAFAQHRAELEAACEAALGTDDDEQCTRAWRRLRSAALWADRPEIAALADRPADETRQASLGRLSEIRRRS